MAYTKQFLVKYTSLSLETIPDRGDTVSTNHPPTVFWDSFPAEGYLRLFPEREEASCNYGIRQGQERPSAWREKNRSWCSPLLRTTRGQLPSSAFDSLPVCVQHRCLQCPDWNCAWTSRKRNGKNKLLWLGDKTKTLNYAPKSGEW